ncbi:MAG: DEDD exonuclease domain-containing protein [Actinomycetota bacterium]|nr:DEDD exonuclease domain-containing protein [Actinomycetota bacterium]
MFQQSLDDLGTPLHEVTFCVLDFETTGGRRDTDMITEVGAVKYRYGKQLGTFQTLIDPGTTIPPQITVLTGITSAMVYRAPKIEQVLPSLLEFVGNSVIVGHNVGFDLSFLNAALRRSGRAHWKGHKIDTLALARRLIRDDVPNHKLATLARCLRLTHQPSHRALDDALATADLLHLLLEQASTLGVLGLDDLQQLPKIQHHPQAAKLRLTECLPRSPGVYRFVDGREEVLYVGKATNLRSRVRSYFSSDRRRKVEQLLRETRRIDYTVCQAPLQAEVLEVRLIQQLRPRFNRRSKNWPKYVYVKLTLGERFPRLSIVREFRDDGAFYLGPVSSRRTAKDIVDAIESVTPLRRCTQRVTRRTAQGPCAAAQIGVSVCPCSGEISEESYNAIVNDLLEALLIYPERLLEPLRARMIELATQRRFEEAADIRQRGSALSTALRRKYKLDSIRSAGRLVVEVPGVGASTLEDGRLAEQWSEHGVSAGPLHLPEDVVSKSEIDELWCVASWLSKQAGELRLLHCDQPLSSRYPDLDDFQARNTQTIKLRS